MANDDTISNFIEIGNHKYLQITVISGLKYSLFSFPHRY